VQLQGACQAYDGARPTPKGSAALASNQLVAEAGVPLSVNEQAEPEDGPPSQACNAVAMAWL